MQRMVEEEEGQAMVGAVTLVPSTPYQVLRRKNSVDFNPYPYLLLPLPSSVPHTVFRHKWPLQYFWAVRREKSGTAPSSDYCCN